MKKALIAGTALVAAGMMTASAANAADKIKLSAGGYSKWWVVGAWQDDNYTRAGGANVDINSVDIKGDNEIFFGGETTLDNGLKVGVSMELEAGGNTETKAGEITTGDIIDKSFVFVEGGFGKVILGSEANGTVLLHVMAPDAAANTAGDGIITGGFAIAKPTAVDVLTTTEIDTDDNADKITYVAPSFGGLTLGASYVPNSSEDNRGVTNLKTQTAGEIFGVGAGYARTFGGVDLKLSAGYVVYDLENNQQSNKSGVEEISTGAQLSFAGFTVGGSYRKKNGDSALDHAGADASAWDAGVQYASGPYAVSFVYFQSEVDASALGDDKLTVYQVSGKYTMGPGVDALATVGHAEYEDGATTTDANKNKGWAVMTGLSLAF